MISEEKEIYQKFSQIKRLCVKGNKENEEKSKHSGGKGETGEKFEGKRNEREC